jgi:amino acid permease
MFHHSLPGIVHTLSNPNDIQFVIRNAFIISASVLILIPLTGLFAFGSYLTIDNKDNTVYPPDKLKYYNLDFQN